MKSIARARFFLLRLRMLPAVLFMLALPAEARASSQTALVIGRSLDQLQQDGRMGISGVTVVHSAVLVDLYRRRGFEPLWPGRRNVDDLVATIRDTETQGLDPRDYHLDAIVGRGRDGGNPAVEAAARDLLMTDAFVQIAHDVRYGRASPDSPNPDVIPASLDDGNDPVSVMQNAIDRGRVRDFVTSLEPQNTLYARLKQALATYRGIQAAGGWRALGTGPTPKPGQRDPRMPALRDRLVATGDLSGSRIRKPGDVYDNELANGVRAFQSRHGLSVDGALGARTLAALNVPVEARIGQIRAALERSRWFLHDLPARYVMVNVAAFQVQFVENENVIWRSRVIVGERDKETPMFRSSMQSIVLNPTWSVPDSIVKNELLPGLQKDPGYLARKQIVRTGNDYVQSAGKHNALGRIKMMLPNPFSVYLHDTPTKSLFDRTTRTLSHGCVRVENPVELAALALDDPKWSVEALNRTIAKGQTRTITLRSPVPVFLFYSSVTFGRDGTVEFLPDVYGLDQQTLRGIGRQAPARQKAAASV